MNFVVAILIFFSTFSFAAEITHFSEKSVGVKNEQVRLALLKIKFPNKNILTIEEKIVDDKVIVHMILQNDNLRVLAEQEVAFERLVKFPGYTSVNHHLGIPREKEFYTALDSDNFVIFGTTQDFLVIREDGLFSRLYAGDSEAQLKTEDVQNLTALKSGRDLTRLTYNLGSKVQTIDVETILKDLERMAEREREKAQAAAIAAAKDAETVPSSEVNLLTEEVRLRLKDQGAEIIVKNKVQAVTNDKVIQYSVRGKQNDPKEVEMVNDQNRVALLITEKDVLLVSDKGHVRKIEVARSRLQQGSVTINNKSEIVLMPKFATVESDGKVFAILSFQYQAETGSTGPSKGETYVWDIETNDLVRVAYRPMGLMQNPFSVDDGILTIDNIDRKIDLRNLKAENSFFQPALPPALKNENNSNFDAIKETESTFPNIAEDFRTGRKKPFALDKESKELIDNLTAAMGQKESPNPMVVAEAGTGKTSLVYGFIAEVLKGNVPGVPRTVRVYELQVSTLEQGTMYTGMLSQRLKALEGAAMQVPTIVFADEIHALRGSGTHKGNPDNDALSKLKPALMNGTFHMIGTSTEEEFNNAFSGDPALMRRFSLIKKQNPTKAQIFKAMDSWTERYGYPRLSEDVKQQLLDLSDRYVVYGSQPSKATSLMDKAYARKVYLKRSEQVITKEDMIEALIANGVDKKLFETRSAAETLEDLKKGWAEKMSGQEQARDAYFELEALRLGGLLNPNKPASLLVTGPRGAGKTRGAETYAQFTNRRFVKLNMADYAEGGVKEFQKRLSQEIFKDRFAVFLFDEIEKASPAIKNILLAILQDGKIKVPAKLSASADTSNSTETLDFTQTTIVCTSNAGEHFVVESMQGNQKPTFGFSGAEKELKQDLASKTKRAVLLEDGLKNAAMADGLSSFFLDRFTLIIPAFPSKQDQFRQVVDINLTQMLKEYSKEKGFEFEVISKNIFLDFAVEAYYRENMSNRIIETILHKHFRKEIAYALAPLDQKNVKKVLIEFNPQSGESKVKVLTACEAALQ